MPSAQYKVTLKGFAEVVQTLNGLKQSMRGRILRKAVTKAVQPITKDAKARAPVEDGYLKKSIGYRIQSYKKSGAVVGVIGPRTGYKKNRKTGKRELTALGKKLQKETYKRPTYYAHLVEMGTQPHAIGKGDSLKKNRQAGKLHPGARPKPFLLPAWRAGKARAEQTLLVEIAAGIERELAKLAAKTAAVAA